MNDTSCYCDLCNISYVSNKQYTKHLQTKKHKRILEKIFECKICKRKFTTKANHDRHLKKIHQNNLNIDLDIDYPKEKIAVVASNDIDVDVDVDVEENDKIVDIKNKDKYEKELDLLKMVYELKHENVVLKFEKNNIILEKDNAILKKDNQIQKEQFEKELFKQKFETSEQKSEIHEKDKIFAQDVAKSTIKTTDTAVNGLTYVRKNYPNAPVLKKLDKYDFGEEDEKLIELVLFYSRKKTLSHYIGDFLIKFYKKNDPNDQSLWTTDIARLTFIVKQILKKKSDWHYDKKGIKVCNTIINPLLSNIKTILKKYNDDIYDMINCKKNDNSDSDSEGEYESQSDYDRHKNPPELDNNDKMKLVSDQQIIVQIITDINNKTLAKEIIKYISPLLSLMPCKE